MHLNLTVFRDGFSNLNFLNFAPPHKKVTPADFQPIIVTDCGSTIDVRDGKNSSLT